MDEGFIKLQRRIIKSACFQNAELFKLWIYLLMRANYIPSKTMNGLKEIAVNRGQFQTSRHNLSIELGFSESKIERLLKCLEKMGQIGQQADSRRTAGGQQADSRRTAGGHK